MKVGGPRTGATALRQRGGFALIAMLTLAFMIMAFLIAIGLNRSKAELSGERENRNLGVLTQAKAALIAYAASEQWQLYTSPAQPSNQPGGLPCPDTGPDTTPANTGVSSGICSNGMSRVGRLPFATIGADDLRDASGERLWYAVSSNFYRNFGNNVINSDAQGLLSVTGNAPASNVIAIVFAPGPPVQDWTLPGQIQDRSAANYNRIASYLEKFTAGATDYAFNSSALPDETFNDRLLVITQADLMAAVEPVVAARIERTVKPFLTTYFAQWGAFPFPSKFNSSYPGTSPDPGTSGSATTRWPMTYIGDPSQTGGLLPISAVAVSAATNTSPIVVTTNSPHTLSSGNIVLIAGVQGNTAAIGKWTVTVVDSTHFQLNGSSGSGTYTTGGTVTPSYPWSSWSVNKAGGSGRVNSASCSTVSTPSPGGLQCTFQATDDTCGLNNCIQDLAFQIQAQVGQNAGRTFATLPAPSSAVTMLDGSSSTFTSVSLTGSLDNNGVGTVTYIGTLPASINCVNTCSNHNISVTIPDVVSSGINDPSNVITNNVGWFIANEWYRQTYYSVSPGYLPGAAASCVSRPAPPAAAGSPSCLLVNNLPANFAPYNDKRAIFILAGRSLNGSPRPSSSPNNYLEGANQTALTTIPYVYEHRVGFPTSINDRVVVVSP